MIRPYKVLKPNDCRVCDGKLILEELEATINILDNFGKIRSSVYNLYDPKLICNQCGKEYEADKRGMHFFIKKQFTDPIIKSKNPFMIGG